MDTQDQYPWLELDDPRQFQTDRQILESAIDLSQSCLTSTQKIDFFIYWRNTKMYFVYEMK